MSAWSRIEPEPAAALRSTCRRRGRGRPRYSAALSERSNGCLFEVLPPLPLRMNAH